MSYEPRYERFEALAANGSLLRVEFLKSGFLALGDQPELFFFRLARGDAQEAEAAQQAIVAISGDALRRFERARPRRFSREEKIDIAGLWLKRQMEAGAPLDSAHLLVGADELTQLSHDLGFESFAK